MKRQGTQPEKSEDTSNPREGTSAIDIAKRATSITERLCHLYVTITQNMDPSLIRYYLQHDKVRKLFKRHSQSGQTAKTEQ